LEFGFRVHGLERIEGLDVLDFYVKFKLEDGGLKLCAVMV
jgi:hypothetical protein